MTCRVARLFEESIPINPVCCGKCGARDLEVLFSSKILGVHVCPRCLQSMIGCDVEKELGSEVKREKSEYH